MARIKIPDPVVQLFPPEIAVKMDELLLRLRRMENNPPINRSQEAFNRLPGLVGRQTFIEWTGLDKSQLSEEVRRGRIQIYKPEGRARALYYKHEIARMCGLKL